MSKFKDLTNQKFGRLTVIKRVQDKVFKSGQHKSVFLCKCDCGNEVCVEGAKLRNGHTKSCGCLQKEIFAEISRKSNSIHCHSNTRLYHIWEGLKSRCMTPTAHNYKNYGGRGIQICNEWHEFKTFYAWALNNGYSANLTIDRIDVDGNYEPNNCRWVSWKLQQNNRRNNNCLTFKNTTHTIAEWAAITNISYTALYHRIKRGWPIEKALSKF